MGRAAGLTASFRAHVNIVSLLTYLLTYLQCSSAVQRQDRCFRPHVFVTLLIYTAVCDPSFLFSVTCATTCVARSYLLCDCYPLASVSDAGLCRSFVNYSVSPRVPAKRSRSVTRLPVGSFATTLLINARRPSRRPDRLNTISAVFQR